MGGRDHTVSLGHSAVPVVVQRYRYRGKVEGSVTNVAVFGGSDEARHCGDFKD